MLAKTKYVLAFGGGFLVGAVSAFFAVKRYYQKIADRDIASIKEMYRVKNEKTKPQDTNKNDAENTPEERGEYEKVVRDLGYSAPSTESLPKPTYSPDDGLIRYAPFVISPDIFGDDEEYGRENLTWYADCVLADEYDEIIYDDQIEKMIGADALNHFGEYVTDAVYVQNDELKMYYEILLDTTNYFDRFPASLDYVLALEEEEE